MFAEEANYWKSGNSSPDTWIEKAIKQIDSIGGSVNSHAFGADGGKSAFMLQFDLDGQQFKIVWPVLESKSGNYLAARRQAATMLFHHVKAKCISAQVLGARVSFFAHLMLPDGRVAHQVADNRIERDVPQMLIAYEQG